MKNNQLTKHFVNALDRLDDFSPSIAETCVSIYAVNAVSNHLSDNPAVIGIATLAGAAIGLRGAVDTYKTYTIGKQRREYLRDKGPVCKSVRQEVARIEACKKQTRSQNDTPSNDL